LPHAAAHRPFTAYVVTVVTPYLRCAFALLRDLFTPAAVLYARCLPFTAIVTLPFTLRGSDRLRFVRLPFTRALLPIVRWVFVARIVAVTTALPRLRCRCRASVRVYFTHRLPPPPRCILLPDFAAVAFAIVLDLPRHYRLPFVATAPCCDRSPRV